MMREDTLDWKAGEWSSLKFYKLNSPSNIRDECCRCLRKPTRKSEDRIAPTANFIVDRVAGIAKCVQPVPQLVVPTTTNDRHDIDSVEHLPKPVRAYGEHEEPTEVA